MKKLASKRLLLLAADAVVAGITLSAQDGDTATPVKHLVVIFGENVSFDHYFGTYPKALNPTGQPRFTAEEGTPAVDGLTEALLKSNPNFTNSANGASATNPFRLDRTQAFTASHSHSYQPEQQAFNN